MDLTGRRRRWAAQVAKLGNQPPTPRLGTPHTLTQLNCRQGEQVKGCQREFTYPGQRTVGTSPIILVTNNPYRDAVIITNTSTSTTLFVGPWFITPTIGQPIPPLQSLTFPTTAEIYGVVASGSVLAGFTEIAIP